jgi:uncharacterized small protein (DUF1192 family)
MGGLMLVPQGNIVLRRDFVQTIHELRERIRQLEQEIAALKQADPQPKRQYTRRAEVQNG